jgi:hypothetical protein
MRMPTSGLSKSVFCFFALALVGLSCSSKEKFELFPVRGKVLVKDKPAGGVMLMFLPPVESDKKAARPLGLTSEDGTFMLVTNDEEGAPAGDYLVTMQWLQNPPPAGPKKGVPMPPAGGDEPVDKLGGRYLDRKKAFKVTIVRGDNELPAFKLQ